MSLIDQELPEGWTEALPEDPGFVRHLAEQLPALTAGAVAEAAHGRQGESAASSRALGQAGVNRLLASVAELPARYAPFFGRIAELWDVSEEVVTSILDRGRIPSAWKRTPLPGVRILEASGGPRTSGADVFLVRFAPGTRFPRHRHPGHEWLLVLEGSYTDSLGVCAGPGDLHEMAPGTEHGFVVGPHEPCIGAVLQFGREFTNPILRTLDKLIGR